MQRAIFMFLFAVYFQLAMLASYESVGCLQESQNEERHPAMQMGAIAYLL